MLNSKNKETLDEFVGSILVPIRKDFFTVGNTRLNIDSVFVRIEITKYMVVFPEHEIPKDTLYQFLPNANSLQQSLQRFICNDIKLYKSCLYNRVGYTRKAK